MNVPALRFPEFEGEWKTHRVDDILERVSNPVEVQPDVLYRQIGVRSHGRGLFHKEAVTGTELGDKRVFNVVPNAFVVNIVFGWEQAVALTTDDEEGFIASHRFPMFLEKNEKSFLPFIRELFMRKRGKQLLELASPGGAGRNKTLGQQEFLKLKVKIPDRDEQKKIAAFLGAVDAKIAALQVRVAGLERYKRGLSQAVFNQTLRFKKLDGNSFPDWKEKRFGEVFDRITRKNVEGNQNVLTISAQQGLVNQRDYFNKSVSARDLSGYYLLHKGDFAYNKSYSKGYPMGAIKRLNLYEKGVVSTLYICFRTQAETSARFYEQFFEFGGLNREIHKIAQEGARNHGLLNMSVVEFFRDITIPCPHPEEQAKIAAALSAMDAKIAAVTAQLDRMQDFKKGLLQQMFV